VCCGWSRPSPYILWRLPGSSLVCLYPCSPPSQYISLPHLTRVTEVSFTWYIIGRASFLVDCLVNMDAANEKSQASETEQSSNHTNSVSQEDKENGRGHQPTGEKPTGQVLREEKQRDASANGKREITEEECEDQLGFAFPTWRKWWILTVIFLVQTSMNFNTSLYSNGLAGISEEFNVSEQAARAGAAIFLILYAFGCELWAPWSEEFGRKPVLQLSLFLVNVWCLPVALAPNFASLMVGRALGGLSSAGGSVTLGMIADLFDPGHQQ
jgi:hypothetical protein